jgi:hypothetical protein
MSSVACSFSRSSAFAEPTINMSRTTTSLQLLVRFQDKTHVVSVPSSIAVGIGIDIDGDDHHQLVRAWLLQEWAPRRTGWKAQHLRIASSFQSSSSSSSSPHFVDIRVKSGIRGGKGGFGTLLKGQSRQAGAKLTTDFGACRDLQGRRLRHVNDEIKLRKWREMERRKANGETVPDDELWNTPSGIYNWHLMTPTWADISKKATYRIKRQFQQLDKEAQKKRALQQEQEEAYQKTLTHYLEQATDATASIQESFQDALKQGLSNNNDKNNDKNNNKNDDKKKRKRPTTRNNTTASSSSSSSLSFTQPNSLCTLSGDVVVVTNHKKASVEMQSKSDFGTAVLVLDREIPKERPVVYYEVSLESGGMAQIGWARLVGGGDKDKDDKDVVFQPNDESGDGVGDDVASFGVDGSRGMKFHAGTDGAYRNFKWKRGDRLGCSWDTQEGSLSFHVNGKDAGVAFSKKENVPKRNLVPAFSCNQGEIIELHTTKDDCNYFPQTGAIAVGELIESVVQDQDEDQDDAEPALDAKKSAITTTNTTTKSEQKEDTESKTTKPPVIKEEVKKAPFDTENIKPLNLLDYESAKELEALGMDRLKGALMAIKVKCG